MIFGIVQMFGAAVTNQMGLTEGLCQTAVQHGCFCVVHHCFSSPDSSTLAFIVRSVFPTFLHRNAGTPAGNEKKNPAHPLCH